MKHFRYAFSTLAICTLLIVGNFAHAGDDLRRYTLDNTRYHTLESEKTGKAHDVIVVLPASYRESPEKRYPVFYYLDAYWDTPLLSAIYGNLIYDNVIPEMIMVGLSYPGEDTDYGKERRQDYTPTNEGKQDGRSGNAPAFLSFIKEDVVPMIEKQYRADSSQRGLGGLSLGGLFTLYAMYQDPEFFDRYVSISPAASWDNDYVAALDKQYAKNHKNLNARLFLSYGTAEYAPFRDAIIRLQKQLAKRNYKGIELQSFAMEGLRHTGVKADGYTRGLMWVWKDIAPTGPSGLEQAYQ